MQEVVINTDTQNWSGGREQETVECSNLSGTSVSHQLLPRHRIVVGEPEACVNARRHTQARAWREDVAMQVLAEDFLAISSSCKRICFLYGVADTTMGGHKPKSIWPDRVGLER